MRAVSYSVDISRDDFALPSRPAGENERSSNSVLENFLNVHTLYERHERRFHPINAAPSTRRTMVRVFPRFAWQRAFGRLHVVGCAETNEPFHGDRQYTSSVLFRDEFVRVNICADIWLSAEVVPDDNAFNDLRIFRANLFALCRCTCAMCVFATRLLACRF